jgi:hypothetical protein
MKKLLLLSVILLAACNKQDEPSAEPAKATIIPYVKKHHAKSDPPAQLDFLQLVQVVISSFPNAQASYNGNATELRLLSKRIPSDSKFKTYENWYSIKITRNIDSENWSNFLVEIRDNQSYEQSKTDAFNACKDVWRNIDHRVPTVINELAVELINMEKIVLLQELSISSAMVIFLIWMQVILMMVILYLALFHTMKNKRKPFHQI